MPAIEINGSYIRFRFPKFKKEHKYLDWREVTHHSVGSGGKVRKDFDSPNNLLENAWREVIRYLERYWQQILLK
ncbi:MAG: hypothetical protein PHW01_00225 [Patescibacteria group bacterium]|nr:hypothetical protein [Patescibacteria group bacterium]